MYIGMHNLYIAIIPSSAPSNRNSESAPFLSSSTICIICSELCLLTEYFTYVLFNTCQLEWYDSISEGGENVSLYLGYIL